MSQHDDISFIRNAILNEVRREMEGIIEEEIANAQLRIRQRIFESVDKIALGVAAHYQMQMNRGEIVITVKKDLPK